MAYANPVWLAPVACSTPGAALFAIKELLKLAGWTVEGSGDGVATVSLAGADVITHGGSGAGGFNNSEASGVIGGSWVTLVRGTRRLLIQLTSNSVANTSSGARVFIDTNSYGQTWNTASATAIISPAANASAPHAQWICGTSGGTDKLGFRFIAWSAATCYLMGGADQDGEGAFWFAAMEDATNSQAVLGFAMEEVDGDPDDTDPVVFYSMAGSTTPSIAWGQAAMSVDNVAATGTPCRAEYFTGTGSSKWGGAPAAALETATGELGVSNAGYVVSPYDGAYVVHKLAFGSLYATTDAMKGYAKSLAWYPISDTAGVQKRRTFTHLTANDYIRFGNCLLPWNGTLPANPSTGGAWSNGGTIRFADDWRETEGAADAVAPTITLVSPADGVIGRNTPIVVDVADETEVSISAILARFPGGTMDVVHTGYGFGEHYRGSGNTREELDGGLRYRYTLIRNGGWTRAPKLEFLVRDAGGNAAVVTL